MMSYIVKKSVIYFVFGPESGRSDRSVHYLVAPIRVNMKGVTV